MRKFLIVFLLMPFAAVFSQTLKFDIMAKYSTIRKEHSYENSIYGISTNNNYFMRVLNNPIGGQTAQVFDLKSKKKHEYKIIEENSKSDGVKVNFLYLNSVPFSDYFPKSTELRTLHYDFNKIYEEDSTETVNLTFYKNKHKTKPREILELKIIKSDINLFPMFRFACMHPYELLHEMNYDKPGLVLSCTFNNGSSKYTLTTFEEANLEVVMPN